MAKVTWTMRDSAMGKLLCLAAPILAGLAHISSFYIHLLLPYPAFGGAAVGAGLCGIIVSVRANRRQADRPVSKAYFVLAVIGIIVGAFYASIIGPFVVFFPKI